jgi:periodic tryptophan protein 2
MFQPRSVFLSGYSGAPIHFQGESLIIPSSNRLKVVDLLTQRQYTLPFQASYDIHQVSVSEKSTLIADTADRVYLVNNKTGKVVGRMTAKSVVTAMVISPNGERVGIATGRQLSVYQTPCAMNGYQFILLKRYVGHTDDISHLLFETENVIISSGFDGLVRIWDITCKTENQILSEHIHAVRACVLVADGAYLFTVSRTGFVIVYQRTAVPVATSAAITHPYELKEKVQLSSETSNHQGSVTSVSSKNSILCVGYSSSTFQLFDLPSLSPLQQFTVGYPVSSISMTADWVAVGVAENSSILVWEWKSNTFIYKQTSSTCSSAIAFSNVTKNRLNSYQVGSILAIGSFDGKLRLFDLITGFNFVTFSDHIASIEAVAFTTDCSAVISASLDGSIRAYDLLRYRNFRTMSTPDSVQFHTLAVEGDIIVASGSDFKIHVFSLKTGGLLESLSGHESKISTLKFLTNSLLMSSSWDNRVLTWNVWAGGSPETYTNNRDVTALAVSHNGLTALALLSGKLLFIRDGKEEFEIDALRDILTGRKQADRFNRGIRSGQRNLNQYFNGIEFSGADVLVAISEGSPYVYLYGLKEKAMLNRIQITMNLSLDGVQVFLNSKYDKLAGSDGKFVSSVHGLSGVEIKKKRKLEEEILPGNPGKSDSPIQLGEQGPVIKQRSFQVSSLACTPDSIIVGTSEGAFLYERGTSSSSRMIGSSTSGYQQGSAVFLDTSVTTGAIQEALDREDLSEALALSLALNDSEQIQKVLHRIPLDQINPVIRTSLSSELLIVLIAWLGRGLHPSGVQAGRGLELYLIWLDNLMRLCYSEIDRFNDKQKTVLVGLKENLHAMLGHVGELLRYNRSRLELI